MSKIRVTPEDLMDMVVAADVYRSQALSGEISPILPPTRRPWLETLFNLFGLMIGQLHVLLPWPLRWRADNKANLLLSKHRTAVPADFNSVHNQIAALTRRLHAFTGQWPATLGMISHPPTTGALEWLRFEAVRLALLLADTVVRTSTRPWRFHPRPECLLAIDPFALDTITTPVAGLYSGFMHRIYLVYDRQSRTQSWLQKHLFLRHTGYDHIADRLLERLKQNIPVVMVFPGGLPHNARLLYTAREFILKIPITRWPYPKHIAQQKWMDVLRRPVQGIRPCEKGEIPASTQASLRQLLGEWGLPDAQQDHWMEVFVKEFRQGVPYRTRLMRFLLRRLVARGKPMIFLAIAHSEREPYLRIVPPWGIYCDSAGTLQLLQGDEKESKSLTDIEETAQAFSQLFLV